MGRKRSEKLLSVKERERTRGREIRQAENAQMEVAGDCGGVNCGSMRPAFGLFPLCSALDGASQEAPGVCRKGRKIINLAEERGNVKKFNRKRTELYGKTENGGSAISHTNRMGCREETEEKRSDSTEKKRNPDHWKNRRKVWGPRKVEFKIAVEVRSFARSCQRKGGQTRGKYIHGRDHHSGPLYIRFD